MQNQNDFSELSVPKERQAHSFFVFFKVIFIPLAIYILAILAYLGVINFQMKLHTIVMMGVILFVAFIFSRHSALVAYSNFLANTKDYKIRLKEFIIAHLFEISSIKKANAKFEDFFESYTRNFRNDNLANIGQAVFPMLGILGTFISIAISMPSFSSSTANELEKEIAILLNGVATAFYVSIYGIFLALWWMFFEKIGISKFERFYSEQKELSREFFWQENELNANFMKASVGYFKDSHDAFKMVLDDKFVKELSELTNEKFNSLKELCEVEKNIINQSKAELSTNLKMLNESGLKQDEFVKIHSDMLKAVSAFSNAFKDMEIKILTEHAKLGEIFSRNLNATKESQLKFEQTIKGFDKVLREFSYSLMKEQNDALKEFRASLVESATIFKAAYEQEGRSLEREKERESLIA
ncbi:MotA/TolQ/ExbB proton channel family protein, partial [Campylobacter concisus]